MPNIFKLNYFGLLVLLSFLFACNPTENASSEDKDSIEALSQQIDKDDDNPELYLKRSKAYQAKGDLAAAIEDAQMLIQLDNKNYDHYLYLADLYLASNQIQGTIHTLNMILAVEPQHVEANLKMAELNLMFKRYSHAIESANVVLKNDPYNSKAYFIKAFTQKEKGDTAQAIGNFLEAIKQNPEYYNAFVEVGILFREKKDPVAETYFKNAIEVDASQTNAWYNLALFYQQNDMLNKAQETYRKLIEIAPTFPYSYFNMGYIFLEISGVPEEAAPYFAKAIEQKPDYYEAHYNLGLCLERMGNYQEAAASYQNALKYKNNYPVAIEALNRIDNILHQ